MHPCQNCIVNACCKNECSSFKSYRTFMVKMTIVISVIILLFGFIPVAVIIVKNYGGFPIVMGWITLFSINELTQEIIRRKSPTMESSDKIGGIVGFVFSPFLFIVLALTLILTPHMKSRA